MNRPGNILVREDGEPVFIDDVACGERNSGWKSVRSRQEFGTLLYNSLSEDQQQCRSTGALKLTR
jgi:hypothetical protein